MSPVVKPKVFKEIIKSKMTYSKLEMGKVMVKPFKIVGGVL